MSFGVVFVLYFLYWSAGQFLGISTTEIKRLVNYWNSGPTKLRDCWNFWNYRVSRITRALGCWVLVLWELGSLVPPGP